MAQQNKKITQLPEITNPSISGYTIFDDGVTTSKLSIENLSSVINSDIQNQLDGKQNLLFVTDQPPIQLSGTTGQILVSTGTGVTFDNKFSVKASGNTQDISYIGINPVTADINIVSLSETAEINIGNQSGNDTDNIIIDENGLTIENVLSGQTTTISLNGGIEIRFDQKSINLNNDGFYIENPGRINVPTSVVSGDTLVLLSDLSKVNLKHWIENQTKIVDSTETIVISGDYVLSGCTLIINSDNVTLSYGSLNFNKFGQIFIGGNFLIIDTNIINNGSISIGGGLLLSGNSTITGTGIII